MKVIESTPTRLVLRLGVPFMASTRCTFDKARDAVSLVSQSFLFGIRRRSFPIAEIADVYLRRRSNADGTQRSYHAMLVLRMEGKLELKTASEAEAREAVREIRSFLMAQPA